jgi:hypothetical protein
MSGLLECLLLLVYIKFLLMSCVLYETLLLVLILLCCTFSYLGCTSSNYIDLLPILFSSFHNNTSNILIILVPFFLVSLSTMLEIILYPYLLRNNTYMLLVAMENTLHNVHVSNNCDKLLVL